MATSKERMKYLDMAKGIGMIGVILFHIGLEEHVSMFVGAFMLPLFYMISGFCFRYQDDFLSFFKKRSTRYLIPYFFYGALLVFGFYTVSGFSIDALLFNLKELLVQIRYTTLWYLGSLYFAMLLFWAICKVSKNQVNKIVAISAIVSVLGICYDTLVAVPLFWNIDTAVIVQIYLAIGYLCRQKGWEARLADISTTNKIIYSVALFTATYVLSILNKALGFDEFQMYYCQYGCFPITFMAALSGSLAVVYMSSAVQTKYITYVGKNSMTYFTLHQTIFMEIMFMIYGMLGIDYLSVEGFTPLLCGIATFVFTMAGCTLMNFLFKKTKLKKYI